MTVLKLLGPAWTRAFRCVWMLEELGVPYELVSSAMPISHHVRKYNKSGKVPVLLEFDKHSDSSSVDGEEPSFVLYESVAINTYLADKYGKDDDDDDDGSSRLVPPAGT